MKQRSLLILKFPYSSVFGGGEKHTLLLVEGLLQRGWKVFFVGSCSLLLKEFRKRGWYARSRSLGKEPVSLTGLLVFTFLLPILIPYLFGILLYFRIRRGVRVVYCLSLGEKLIGTPLMRLLGMKPIWVEHLLIERWLLSNPYRPLYVACSGLAEIVAVSNGVKHSLETLGVPSSRIRVLYNGVDTNRFTPRPRANSTHVVIGYIGRFAEEKALEDLVQAFAIAVKERPALRLELYGHGPTWEAIRVLLSSLHLEHQTSLHPWIDDQREALQRFSVVVMPAYRRDSFGIVITEAGAMGIPAIASDLPGFQEVVADNETGRIFPRRNIQQLAALLIDVCDHPEEWQRMGDNAQQRVQKYFSLTTMIDAYDKLLSGAWNVKKS